MKVLGGMKNVSNGLFVAYTKPLNKIETRAQRKKRIRDKQIKQWTDSFLSVGRGYHKW
jgi:hypothetical protein